MISSKNGKLAHHQPTEISGFGPIAWNSPEIQPMTISFPHSGHLWGNNPIFCERCSLRSGAPGCFALLQHLFLLFLKGHSGDPGFVFQAVVHFLKLLAEAKPRVCKNGNSLGPIQPFKWYHIMSYHKIMVSCGQKSHPPDTIRKALQQLYQGNVEQKCVFGSRMRFPHGPTNLVLSSIPHTSVWLKPSLFWMIGWCTGH